MTRIKNSGPTDREIEILNILWNYGPATVRQVNERMNLQQKTGYTTTLKLMQIMAEKGLLIRDESHIQHLYRPSESKENTQKQVVENLLDKVFSGSAEQLVMHVLSTKKISSAELTEIKKLLETVGALEEK
jgi:BlaI family transcriptional regulator, penicillinase repressor